VHRPLVVLLLAVAIVALAVAGTLFAVSERLGDDVVPDPFAALRDGSSAASAQQHPDAMLGPAPAGEEHP
jgi:hypothetical protein